VQWHVNLWHKHRHTYMQKEKDNFHTQACEQPKILIIGWALTLSTFFSPVLSVYARTQFLVVVTLPLSICDNCLDYMGPKQIRIENGNRLPQYMYKIKGQNSHLLYNPGILYLQSWKCLPCDKYSYTAYTQGQVQWQVANAKQEESCGSLFELPRDSCWSQEDVTQLTALQLPFHGLLDNPFMVHPHLFPSIKWLSFSIVHLRFKDAT
jgi:hypothetical protein